jgi:FkbM family methyltransferase
MFDRVIGLARSIAIYHAIPFRQRRLRRLYRGLVGPGDLVIDVGAHAGNHVRALAALGCRVVAIEPQPDFARVLRLLFGRSSTVTILEQGVSDRPGRAQLSISERTPTVTSLSTDWREARAADADFAQVRWNRSIDVAVTTLDALAATYGAPAFIKLDVEGSEAAALAGLSTPVPALAFEYLPRRGRSLPVQLVRRRVVHLREPRVDRRHAAAGRPATWRRAAAIGRRLCAEDAGDVQVTDDDARAAVGDVLKPARTPVVDR